MRHSRTGWNPEDQEQFKVPLLFTRTMIRLAELSEPKHVQAYKHKKTDDQIVCGFARRGPTPFAKTHRVQLPTA